MPQLDPSSFPSQLFWLAVTFLLLFLVVWRLALPRLAQIVEGREAKISDDLSQADSLQKQSASAKAEYELALNSAKDKALGVINETATKIYTENLQRNKQFSVEVDAKLAEAEKRISKARTEALKGVAEAAADVSQATLKLLTGDKADAKEVKSAVALVAKEQGVS